MKSILIVFSLVFSTSLFGMEEGTYTVQKGDTLQGISFLHYETYRCWDVIAKNNSHIIGESIAPGMQLQIPASEQCAFVGRGSQTQKTVKNFKKKKKGDITGYLAEKAVDDMMVFTGETADQKFLKIRQKTPADFKYRQVYRDPTLQKKRIKRKQRAEKIKREKERKRLAKERARQERERAYKEMLATEQREREKIRLMKLKAEEEKRMAIIRKKELEEKERQKKELAFQKMLAKQQEVARQKVREEQARKQRQAEIAYQKELVEIAKEQNEKKEEARRIQIEYMKKLNREKQALLEKKREIERLEKLALKRAEAKKAEEKKKKLLALEKTYLNKALKKIAEPEVVVVKLKEKKVKTRNPASIAPKAKKKTISKYIYTVQLGSYQDINEATELQRKLILGGYEARIEKAEIEKKENKETWYRVRLGKFKNRTQAEGFVSMADFQVFAGEHIILKVLNSGL